MFDSSTRERPSSRSFAATTASRRTRARARAMLARASTRATLRASTRATRATTATRATARRRARRRELEPKSLRHRRLVPLTAGDGDGGQRSAGDGDDRLWSNVERGDDGLRRRAGSLGASVALVAGTTLGAGMLALPLVLRDAGFVPSTVVIVACWVFFAATGLCVLEVNLGTMCELGRGGGVSVNAMCRRTLGDAGVNAATASFAFIHYALLVAYVQKVGELAVEIWPQVPGGANAASVAYATAMSTFLYLASPAKIERFNSALFAGVVGTFVPLLLLAARSETTSVDNLLAVSDWSAAPAPIPIVAVAFVYHQVVPVVATSLEGDRKRATTAVLAGTAIPALMFILWDAAVLGSVDAGAIDVDPIGALQASSPLTAALVRGFEFFAVSTSFLGFGWGLADFLADGMKTTDIRDPRPWALALVPPVIFALACPGVFLAALDSAGAFGVLVVFGMIPPAMVYRHRQMRDECALENDPVGCLPVLDPVLPGGALTLALMFAFAASEVGSETIGLARQWFRM